MNMDDFESVLATVADHPLVDAPLPALDANFPMTNWHADNGAWLAEVAPALVLL